MSSFMEAADGRWREILISLGGVSSEQLTNRHQPCPACGGTDRFRWDSDEGRGSCYCNQCGGRDRSGGGMTGMDLLMRLRNWSFREAALEVRQFLGLETVTDTVQRTARPFRTPDKPPVDAQPPERRGMVGRWCYRNEAGEQLFWVCRFPTPSGGKRFQNALWLDGAWHFPSRRRDGFDTDWPAPRPLYGLDRLAAAPLADVIIAEGEKAADAAHALLGDHYVCVAFRNGAKAAANTDFSPLAGREVILLPDNDADGEEFVVRTAAQLRQVGSDTIYVCRPPTGSPDAWDIADAADWTTDDALAWLRSAEPEPEPEPEPEIAPPDGTGSAPGHGDGNGGRWDRFAFLGFDDGHYYYHPRSSGVVRRIANGSHTTTALLTLAPLDWWQARWPRLNAQGEVTGVRWDAAVSDIFAEQHNVGIYDPDRVRGMGAWWDRGRSVVNLGDILVIDGDVHPLLEGVPNSGFLYQRSVPINIATDAAPLADERGAAFAALIGSFLWEEESAGMLVAGWTFLAPVCGCLPWRPHIWVTAPAGSGKSTLLNRVIAPAIGQILVKPLGNSSEAGIRQTLRSDARPVMFDEAESNQERDAQRIQNILALARNASSDGDGEVLKGTTSGAAMVFTIRSMFLFCSINTATIEQADRSRFTKATLRKPSQVLGDAAHEQWEALKRQIADVIKPELTGQLMARACAMTGTILSAIQVFSVACAERLGDQRLGDQYGVLCAGAWCLQRSSPPTPDDAALWLDMYPLTTLGEESAAEPDEGSCLAQLMQFQVRVETGDGVRTQTFAELVLTMLGRGDPLSPVDPSAARAVLGRHGVKVQVDGSDQWVLVSNNAKALRSTVFRGTPWAVNWYEALLRVDGASRAGATRFPGIGVSRAVRVPVEIALAEGDETVSG